MAQVDLKTFKPNNARELGEGVLTNVINTLGQSWTEASNEVKNDLVEYGVVGFRIATRLANGEIDQKRADALLHMQELYLNQIVLNVEFWTYVIAQRALDAATAVIKAAIKNITGINLKF